MPLKTVRLLCTVALLLCIQLAQAQVDVSVRVELSNSTPQAGELVYATVYISNEGNSDRSDLHTSLRFSNALFYVDQASPGDFDEATLTWKVDQLGSGERDSLKLAVQPNYGGVHTLTAELMQADKNDWDSTPGNDRIAEDDQDSACLSVPVAVDCGQELVLSAPGGHNAYSWFRDGQLLAATGDTIHPYRSGAYSYQLDGETCATGNCCPVIVERAGCDQDLALRLTAVASNEDDPNLQLTTITLFNQGSGMVSRVSYYVNGSRKMRLAQGSDGWRLMNGQMKRDWEGILAPGDSTKIEFEMLTLPDGLASEYVMFAEIEAFYDGAELLQDSDSTPDDDAGNDAVEDDLITGAAGIDEDDSDIAKLTNCPIVTLDLPERVCAGEQLALTANIEGAVSSYLWTSTAPLSCTTCPSPNVVINETTEISLTTTTTDGCEQVAYATVQTKGCVDALALTITPYATASICFDVDAGQELEWCSTIEEDGVQVSERYAGQQICIDGTSLGAWAGVPAPCVKLCTNGECDPLDLSITVLPPSDYVEVSVGEPVCLADVLQTEGPLVDVTVSEGEQGLALVPAGGGCFKLLEPSGSYGDQTFTVVHTYSLGTLQIKDTTFVEAVGRTVCDLVAFAQDTFSVEVDASLGHTIAGQSICAQGQLEELAVLSFTLDGELLAAPSEECGHRPISIFDFSRLPRGYADNGWRMVRYYLDDVAVGSNKTFAKLEDLFNYLRSFDDDLVIELDMATGELRLSNYSRVPGILQVRHFASGVSLGGRGRASNEAAGAALAIPAGWQPGVYSLTATNEENCTDQAMLIIQEAFEPTIERDTVLVQVEAGDPIVACDLGNMTTADNRWSNFNDGCRLYTASQVGAMEYHTFEYVTNDFIQSRTYQVQVVERHCEPLMVETALTEVSSDCRYANFELGLLYPGLTVQPSSGRASRLTTPTATTPGAVYDLAALPAAGLKNQYRVTAAQGLSQAVGKEGNLAEIAARLRQDGIGVYTSWTTNTIGLTGTGIGKLTLTDLTSGTTVQLVPTSNSLPTYGSFTGRRGTAQIAVSNASCAGSIAATVECDIIIIVGGGGFEFARETAPRISPYDYGMPTAVTEWEIVQEPSTMTAAQTDDAQALIVSSEVASMDSVVVQGCVEGGDCHRITISLTATEKPCALDIWQPMSTSLLADRQSGRARFVLPENFDIEATTVLVNGSDVTGALVLAEVVTEYTFDAEELSAFSEFATPFGKTAYNTGDPLAVLQQVLAEAELTNEQNSITVQTLDDALTLYARDRNDIWQPMRPRVQAKRSAYVFELEEGTHTIQVSDAGANCGDELEVQVIWQPMRLLNERVELAAGENLTYCLEASNKELEVVELTTTCTDQHGERVAVELVDGCLELEAYEAGEEAVCLVRTYLDGSQDSITIDLEVRAAIELATVVDYDTVEFGQFHILEVLANDMLGEGPRQLSLISEPYFGRAQVVGNEAIEYLHNGSDCAQDVFTYELCQGEVCDSATVQVSVFCDDLLIYNGFSPNGDGVNDEFTILGLGQYPNHVLQIFNREGALLTQFSDYKSDWRGDLGGQPLPEGTYYYVIELGDGQRESGYIQLTR